MCQRARCPRDSVSEIKQTTKLQVAWGRPQMPPLENEALEETTFALYPSCRWLHLFCVCMGCIIKKYILKDM